jgi:hypothetical protein
MPRGALRAIAAKLSWSDPAIRMTTARPDSLLIHSEHPSYSCKNAHVAVAYSLMSLQDPTKPSTETGRRRSQRAILSLAVTVRTEGGSQNTTFEETTQTLVVNVHGALIAIAGKVERGQKLRLTNRTTHEERMCHVMYVGPVSCGKAQVGVEFDSPSPDFWRLTFPPDNWTAPESEPAAVKGTK